MYYKDLRINNSKIRHKNCRFNLNNNNMYLKERKILIYKQIIKRVSLKQ